MKSFIDSLVGAIVAVAAGAVLISQKLLLYTEATKRPLLAAGTFGLLTGAFLGSQLPPAKTWALLAGLLGVSAVAGFNWIVQGEFQFQGRYILLYLLAFVLTACLAFLGTLLSRVFRKEAT